MKQTGNDTDGGPFSVFKGINRQNSEHEFIDGVAALANTPWADTFRSNLTGALMNEGVTSSDGGRANSTFAMDSAVVS